jgi:hypothetical protein
MTSARLAPPGGHDGSLGITDEEFDHDRAGVLAWLRAEGDLDFGPAVLDPAHIGDIRGSLGTISLRDRAPRRTWRRRLVTFAAILGPGIIVMTGDNDAGGVQTYTQAGQQYGNSMMWVLLALFVVLFAAQEMVTRLGAVTGSGSCSPRSCSPRPAARSWSSGDPCCCGPGSGGSRPGAAPTGWPTSGTWTATPGACRRWTSCPSR